MRRLMFSVLVLLFLTLAVNANAQTPIQPGQSVAWDTDVDLATATNSTYKLYVDNAAGVNLKHNCAALTASTSTCRAVLPALTAGNHTLQVSVTRTVSGTSLESVPSVALPITMLILTAPTNLRIV